MVLILISSNSHIAHVKFLVLPLKQNMFCSCSLTVFFSRRRLSYHSFVTTLYFIHSVNTYTAQITLRFGNVWRQMPVKNLHAKVLHMLHSFIFKLHFPWSSHISNLHHLIAKFIWTPILQALHVLTTDCLSIKDTDRHQDQKAVCPANQCHLSFTTATIPTFWTSNVFLHTAEARPCNTCLNCFSKHLLYKN
jgi:hypothetical protein